MGKLIVLDGLDGSGKSTQFDILCKNLLKKGLKIKAISFPEYDKPSSALVKMYLNGVFSDNADDVNAYAASSFYAVDRYASYKLYWQNDYNDNDTVVIASRYVSSNAIHQMVKLPESEWDSYLQWLMDYEYIKMGIPRPDKVIFLDMPVDISQRLLSERYEGDEDKKDIHEANIDYLNRCRKSALYASEKLGWAIIPCSDGENPLTIEAISEKITEKVQEVL